MPPVTSHPLLDFADRYGDPTQDYFNAYIAIARLESLQDDLQKVQRLLDADSPKSERFFPWFGAEIISYYAVGFVTCLEWHAKSRLVDLLNFQPSAISIDDVRGTIGDKLIVQMVAKQASVVQLIGASIRITDITRYLSIFGRIFRELRFGFSPVEWLCGDHIDSEICWIKPNEMEYIEYIFQFRHQLVHEVGSSTMGHPNIRDAWDPAEALKVNRLIFAVVAGIEEALTRFAPRMFPNLMTIERWPVSSVTQLSEELDYLNHATTEKISKAEWNDSRTQKWWLIAQERFNEYRQAEEKFIESAEMLHWRYFDARTPLRERLLKFRIGFINDVLSHFATEELDNPNFSEHLD